MTGMFDHLVVDDLEDGEIETDDEAVVEEPKANENVVPAASEKEIPFNNDETFKSKKSDNKKKKPKSHKNEKDYKNKEKNKKVITKNPVDDDFAGTIEKALRKVMNKEEENGHKDSELNDTEDVDERRKSKKRKKRSYDKEFGKKKRKHTNLLRDEVDEDEMMCVRGASPVNKSFQRPSSPYDNNYHSDERDSFGSESSDDSRSHRNRRPKSRNQREERFKDRKNKNRERRRDAHPMQDPDGICLFYMQGKCHKGDDCIYSHDAQPPRKMELCKFYLMECCAKRDKCLYLHSDFPCKYYHTGLPCIYKDECKFSHGKPLTDNFKQILLKHIESAPKEILGDFPRLSREGAALMVNNAQNKLAQQFNPGSVLVEKAIPSLFELNIPKPAGLDMPQNMTQSDQFMNDKSQGKGNKIRHSRWCDSPNNAPPTSNNNNNNPNIGGTQNVLSIQNLTGVLTALQISSLVALGIENLTQLSELTVSQLNQLGLTMNQINEIQLNTMSIQKLGLIHSPNNNMQTSSVRNLVSPVSSAKDLDMRVAPTPLPPTQNPTILDGEMGGKDIDMRLQQSPNTNIEKQVQEKPKTESPAPKKPQDSIDIDQYTKDALKFSTQENSDHCNGEDELVDQQHNDQTTTELDEPKDVDHRVLQYVHDASVAKLTIVKDEDQTESKFDNSKFMVPSSSPQRHDNQNKKSHKRIRRSTTDDEDNNLLIDEKWYSSDEDKLEKTIPKPSSPIKSSPRPITPPSLPPIEPRTVLSKLGDLSKIDISAEVTKLLNTMKETSDVKELSNIQQTNESTKSRDPRSYPKKSPEHKSPIAETSKTSKTKKSTRHSIYECIEGEPTDKRRRPDVDLRNKTDQDFRLPSFGDTDLRHTPSSGDIDFRTLPFKPMPNYTPATEIDGSINTHPTIVFKLKTVDIPRPDYTNIKSTIAKSQALADPRLRKVFRLSLEDSCSDSEKPAKPITSTRVDPRRKVKEASEPKKPTSLELSTVIQNSDWYKESSTNQKILVNQQLASVTAELKKYHQEKTPGKLFDLTDIYNDPTICSIFNNLRIMLNELGEFSYVTNQETLPTLNALMNQLGYNQNTDNYLNSNMMMPMDPNMNNMNMMGAGPMGMGNMGAMGMGNMNMPMGGYNAPFGGNDHRQTPGLLGIAPNIPHNFDNSNFGNMANYNSDNMFAPNNQPYGGNMGDFGNSDSSEHFNRNQNRGGFRGNRNDRWGRGGNNRGNNNRRGWKGR